MVGQEVALQYPASRGVFGNASVDHSPVTPVSSDRE